LPPDLQLAHVIVMERIVMKGQQLLTAKPRRVEEEIFEKRIAVAALQRLAAHEAVDLGVGIRISLNLNHLVGRSTVRTFEIEWLLHRRLL
jgi:hypothetical protein